MAIYRVDSANEEYGEWYFLNGKKSGTLTFTAPNEVGSYESGCLRTGRRGGYSDIAKSNVVRVQLEPVNPIAITASPGWFAPGDLIGVTYSGAPGFDSDWIAIYRAGAAKTVTASGTG
jgi:hypothetical protein